MCRVKFLLFFHHHHRCSPSKELVTLEMNGRTMYPALCARSLRFGIGILASSSSPVLSFRSNDLTLTSQTKPFQYPSRFYRIAKKESDYCSLPCAFSARALFRDYFVRMHRVACKYEQQTPQLESCLSSANVASRIRVAKPCKHQKQSR